MSNGSGVTGEEESGKPDSRPILPSDKGITISLGKHSQCRENVKNNDTTKEFIARYGYSGEDGRRSTVDVIHYDEEARKRTVEVTDGKRDTWARRGEVQVDTDMRATKVRRGGIGRATKVRRGGIGRSNDKENVSWARKMPRYSVDRVATLNKLPDSSHRDGSVYKDTDHAWKEIFHVEDRRETRLEAMTLSNPTDCKIFDGICFRHPPRCMLQIFSLKLAKIPVNFGKVELYGYIAVRDDLEPLLNYVVNVSRDEPIILEQGSHINMAPKRGIRMDYEIVLEYDMRIKTGDHEKDDLQLIDGASVIGIMGTVDCYVFTSRIIGDCGAIDISASRLNNAVEATVEVLISEVQGIFNMCLGCFTSMLQEEISLFDGTIGEPRCLKRYVLAVVRGSQMDLKFKVSAGSSGSSEYCCSFKAQSHGRASQLVETDFTSILVKVTWSVLPVVYPLAL